MQGRLGTEKGRDNIFAAFLSCGMMFHAERSISPNDSGATEWVLAAVPCSEAMDVEPMNAQEFLRIPIHCACALNSYELVIISANSCGFQSVIMNLTESF